MKKFLNLTLAAALAFGFAACQKTNNGQEPDNVEGNSYAKLVFAESSTRAKTDSHGQLDVAGNATQKESNVASAYFFVKDQHDSNRSLTEVGGFSPSGTAQDAQYESAIFPYAGAIGLQESGIVVNGSGLTVADYATDKTLGIDKLSTLAAEGKFVMSSKTNQSITIEANKTDAQVNAGANTFEYAVERVVSKAQVSKANPVTVKMVNKNDNTVEYPGEISDLRYSVAGSGKTVYLFGDNAGGRTMTPSAPTDGYLHYENFKAHTEVTSNYLGTLDGAGKFTKRRDLQKVSDFSLHTLATQADWGKYNSLPIAEDATYNSASSNSGIYFLENSLPELSGYSQALWSDFTHFWIYGKFGTNDNSEIYKLKADKSGVEKVDKDDFSTEVAAERTDVVDVTNDWVDALAPDKKQKLMDDGKLTGTTDNYKLKITIKAHSFFYGVTSKKLYNTLSASRKDGNTETLLFQGGKMGWKVAANSERANAATFAQNLDTRRNNIYSIQITGIEGLGENWNPRDPKDPNLPKPNPEDNPDEPGKDEDEYYDPLTTAIKFKATVLKWNLVHRRTVLK